MSEEVERQFRLGKRLHAKKQREKDLARLKTLSKAPKDPDYRSGFTKSGEETKQLGRPPKPKPPKQPRGSGKFMTQFEKDMNKAKKEGNVKEQQRLLRVKKSVEANIKKFGDQSVKKDTKKSKGPKIGVLTGRRAKRTPSGNILKRMNMGGVMKNRGGTFKGVF